MRRVGYAGHLGVALHVSTVLNRLRHDSALSMVRNERTILLWSLYLLPVTADNLVCSGAYLLKGRNGVLCVRAVGGGAAIRYQGAILSRS